MVHANLHLLTYERCDHLVGMHAAAVADKNNCILLPANCGSGKSTLTAALAGSGFQYCSDDMVFLTSNPVEMRPAPMAMGIKSGSWDVLEKYYPQLPVLASHERADGKVIRYLPPPPHSYTKHPTGTLAVTHIIFPGYREGEKAAVTPLTPAQGLCRITQAGYDVQGGLTEACIEQLVEWIADIPCYEFRYGNLDDAVNFLKEFLQ
jgi:energy-coupling factor transporter ATP-binding protein EcfA2